MQAQAVNHLHIHGLRKGEEAVQIGFIRQLLRVAVGRAAADAQVPDAERAEQIDERLVVWPEIMDAVCVGQQLYHFKTQPHEIRRDDRAGICCVERDGNRRRLGRGFRIGTAARDPQSDKGKRWQLFGQTNSHAARLFERLSAIEASQLFYCRDPPAHFQRVNYSAARLAAPAAKSARPPPARACGWPAASAFPVQTRQCGSGLPSPDPSHT